MYHQPHRFLKAAPFIFLMDRMTVHTILPVKVSGTIDTMLRVNTLITGRMVN